MHAVTHHPVPTLADALSFQVRATGLKIFRLGRDALFGAAVPRHATSDALSDAHVLAEIRSPLWTVATGAKDRALTAGKVQNLRMAMRGLDGIVVPAGQTFGFWRQVGRPSRRRGFVEGRELREGCVIASVGGGLCQLSNALYEAALAAGCEIVERHAHSRKLPGSRAALGHDATVFWNYVDLRFRRARAFRIEVRMSATELVVTLRGETRRDAAPADNDTGPDQAAHDCTSCGQSSCRRSEVDAADAGAPPTAWLVDGASPEHVRLYESMARREDALFLPTRRFGRGRYGWPTGLSGRETTATLATLWRSAALRRAGSGGLYQARAMEADARLARSFAGRLSHLHTHLVVAQNLLPHLWRSGALQGRSFDVLMERLPLDRLQATLDAAAARHVRSPTLADFRAPPALVAAEREALAAAHRLFTTHRGIADLFPATSVLVPFAPAKALPASRGGRTVLFPASAVARKGAYALRDAVFGLDIDLLVAGDAREMTGFWMAQPVRHLAGARLPAELAAVVLPALVEHRPRSLLAALAAGIPVIATPACGLAPREGLTLVPEDDAKALRAALEAVLRNDETSPASGAEGPR